jgi:polyribonucleotide nucleotidyltransferase
VEDVVSLGSDITVRVDDIDPQGKVSLSPVGEDGEAGPASDGPPARSSERSERSDRPRSGGDRPSGDRDRAPAASPAPDGREFVSFEDQFEAQAKEKFGDLGPADVAAGRPEGGGEAPRRNRDRDRRRSR